MYGYGDAWDRWNDEDEQPSAVGVDAPAFDPSVMSDRIREATCLHCRDTFRLGDHQIRGAMRCRCGAAEMWAIGISGVGANRYAMTRFVRREGE